MLRFSADEVYEMAQDLERSGVEFYRQAARLATDNRLQDVLLGFAKMEQSHLEIFSSLRDDLPEEHRRRDEPDGSEDDEEHKHYIRTLVKSHVFGAADEAWFTSPEPKTSSEILGRAVALEKDAIVFMLELWDLVPLHRGRKAIDQILREELQHLRILNSRIHAE